MGVEKWRLKFADVIDVESSTPRQFPDAPFDVRRSASDVQRSTFASIPIRYAFQKRVPLPYLLRMTWIVFAILLFACGVLILIERSGVRTTLVLNFKGDVKRETRFIAQYGQAVCTAVAAILTVQLDQERRKVPVAILIATFGVSGVATVVKRLTGRVRPNREGAGLFLGPTFRHKNARESFPSSHSASAFAMSTVLAAAYPQAAGTFLVLAGLCAALRYVLDAHWPSDVIGGVALGYLAGRVTWYGLGMGAI
jgi:membrane-associated phospholipid phosphatase